MPIMWWTCCLTGASPGHNSSNSGRGSWRKDVRAADRTGHARARDQWRDDPILSVVQQQRAQLAAGNRHIEELRQQQAELVAERNRSDDLQQQLEKVQRLKKQVPREEKAGNGI